MAEAWASHRLRDGRFLFPSPLPGPVCPSLRIKAHSLVRPPRLLGVKRRPLSVQSHAGVAACARPLSPSTAGSALSPDRQGRPAWPASRHRRQAFRFWSVTVAHSAVKEMPTCPPITHSPPPIITSSPSCELLPGAQRPPPLVPFIFWRQWLRWQRRARKVHLGSWGAPDGQWSSEHARRTPTPHPPPRPLPVTVPASQPGNRAGKREKRDTRIGKEEVKLSLFADDGPKKSTQ